MNSAEVEIEISLRMYRWAVLDAQREVKEDYPLVKSIQNYQTQNYLQYVAQLSYEDRIKLAVGLVKMAHSVAIKHLNEVTTEDEKQSVLQYRSYVEMSYPDYLNSLRSRKCETCILVDKDTFFKRIVTEIKSLFQCPIKKSGRFSCSTTIPIGPWFLKTTVELLSRTEGWPRYYQYILKKPEEPVALLQLPSHKVTNLLFWMGIHSETVWDTPFEVDTQPALKSLVTVCQHLPSFLPDILEGLEPSSFDIRAKVAEWKNLQK